MPASSKEFLLLADSSPDEVIERAVKMGFRITALSPEAKERVKDLVGLEELVKIEEWPSRGELTLIKVKAPEDLTVVEEAASKGKVLIDSEGWKIIPLENLIASLGGGDRIYAMAKTLDEARSLLGVLEVGVRGVVMPLSDPGQLTDARRMIEEASPLQLSVAEVTEVKEIGVGDRVCVDTTSILSRGEGMLVGGSASFFLLVHSENIKSPFTSPREFRVNAGAVSNYVVAPGGRTKYLAEVRSGEEVLAVDKNGRRRVVSVGRAKVERRPLVLVRARVEGEEGWAALQLAETVPLMAPDGSPLPVSEVKPGDKILVYVEEKKARHFGMAVDEFIEER